MTAEETLRTGSTEEALAELQEEVRRDPANAKHRIFLFQLLSVLGQWDRALAQLEVVGELEPGRLLMVAAYREALRCEKLRRDVFAGRRSPLFVGEPERWSALLVEALRESDGGRPERGADLRQEAFETAPGTSGTIDGTPFEWIADADMRLGPILEAVVNGRYYWVPFQRIRRIAIEAPTDLRDFVWLPARFQWANGGDAAGLIPTRYAGSEESDDDRLRMARRTEWTDRNGTFEGLGQRVLTTDGGEHALLDVREIRMGSAAETDETCAAGSAEQRATASPPERPSS